MELQRGPRRPERSAEWWRGAVVYQIYPRSFADTNGDGIGDLAGITSRLDHVKDLGADAIWISPFFKSPMKDFGYDVSDYRDVDPMFGALADFDRLVAEAHARGIRVMIDLVLNHTSDRHPWFVDSRSSKESRRADWYVWADPKPDGSPPNNWLSIFGGVAWEWVPERRQYYLHNFLVSQPDLNFHNEEVVEEVLDITEFWLRRGVDGLRLDTANFYFHDALLRDNPPAISTETTDGTTLDNPYAYQEHIYDKTRPENFGFLARLRRLLDRYEGRFTIGEIGSNDSLKTAADYVRGTEHLHTAYTFNLLAGTFSTTHVRKTLERMDSLIEDGWPCWSFGNHDSRRVVTRWGNGDDRFGRAAMALLLSIKGTVCIYQGEELGLTEADVPFEKLRDPYGITFWPKFKGRDGCRTPIPWKSGAPHGGFSEVEPWLPVPRDHAELAVDRQDGDERSMLELTRRLLAFRREHPALIRGRMIFLDAPEPLLVFERRLEGERLLCAYNFGESEIAFETKSGLDPIRLLGSDARIEGQCVILPPLAFAFAKIRGDP